MAKRTLPVRQNNVGQAILALFVFLLLTLTACAGAPAPAPTAAGIAPTVTAEAEAAQPTATVVLPTAVPSPTLLPTLTPVPTVVPETVYVDAAASRGPISPLVYGTNYGPWLFVTLDVQPRAVAAKLTYLRYPGGNWGDLNDLDDWSVDQYIAMCKTLGTAPAISVRLKGGTPEKAAALVKRVNIDKQYGVKYWSIGNEPTLYGEDYDTTIYNKEWRAFAEAMEAVDPNIILIGPEPHQYTADLPGNPKDKNGVDWLAAFLQANGDMVDVVAIHRYPFPRGGSQSVPDRAELIANSEEWDATIPALRAEIRKHAGRDLPVAITEVNSSWVGNCCGTTTMDSFPNALWWGDALGRMIRQGVDIVAQFDIIGEYGLMDKSKVYPIYYVYMMYQKFGTERIQASSPDPDMSIFAAKRADGTLTLMFVNRSPQAKRLPVKVENFKPGESEAWLFDVTHNAEQVGRGALGAEVNLPAESMVLYVVKPGQ